MMIRYALENLEAIFRNQYMPYERKVCLWSWNLRLVFVLVPAFAMAGWWWFWWPLVLFMWLLWPWAAYTVWGAGWIGGFVWADLGPGQWFAHRCLGYGYNPNVINTTLEGFEGPKEAYPDMIAHWQRDKFARLRLWDGDPGSGRFGDE